jgi:1-deoxy-D-xylulose-5-phosphate synthase
MTGRRFVNLRRDLENFIRALPGVGENIMNFVRKGEDSFITFFTPGMLFEAFRFKYIGPINGHRLDQLIEALKNARYLKGPVLVHVLTEKGKGYGPAEKDPCHYHGVGCFEISTGSPSGGKAETVPTYTEVFGKTMVALGRKNPKLFAVTAAMPEGTGLTAFSEAFPDRFLDVGIAEQHAVTFAAGLATEGFRPVVAIYSTFLQRAFDQIVHDVCLPNLPVVFAIDRGGLVGEDGPTHHGHFDLSYLRYLPNMTVAAPRDENELQHMLHTALTHQGPMAIRYPRGKGEGVVMTPEYETIPVGEAEVLKEGDDLVIAALGSMVHPAMKAALRLDGEGFSVGVVNIRFVKPMDPRLGPICASTGVVLTVEENVRQGGLGSALLELLNDHQYDGIRVQRMGLPDRFVEAGPVQVLRQKYGLESETIYKEAKRLCLSKSARKRTLNQHVRELRR